MKRPGMKEVIGVVGLLLLSVVATIVTTELFGTRKERREASRERWHQAEMREKFKGAENAVWIEPPPSLDEERAAEARLRRYKGEAPANHLIEAMPQ